MIARIGAVVAAALLIAACGGDAEGRYDAQVDQVRDAVRAGDRDAALASLEQLGTEGLQAQSAGEVTDEELAQLADLLEQARAQLDEELPAPTTTTETTTTTAPPATPPPEPAFVPERDHDLDEDSDGDDDGKKGKVPGKGRGGDDGGDDDD